MDTPIKPEPLLTKLEGEILRCQNEDLIRHNQALMLQVAELQAALAYANDQPFAPSEQELSMRDLALSPSYKELSNEALSPSYEELSPMHEELRCELKELRRQNL